MSTTQRTGISPSGSDNNRNNRNNDDDDGGSSSRQKNSDTYSSSLSEQDHTSTDSSDVIRTPAVNEGTETEDKRDRLRTTRSIERSWSLNDGYSCHTGDEQSAEKKDDEEKVTGAEQPPEFVVAFDENDPMNPRNLSTPRRWLVVLICSLGSLCV